MENIFLNTDIGLISLFCLVLFPLAIAQTLIAFLFSVEAFIYKSPKGWILAHWSLIAAVFLLTRKEDVFFQIVLYCFLSPIFALILYCHKRKLKLMGQNAKEQNSKK